jgi:hypothetical protein
VLGIFITHKNPPPSVGFESAAEYPVGPVASTGLPKAAFRIACTYLNLAIMNVYAGAVNFQEIVYLLRCRHLHGNLTLSRVDRCSRVSRSSLILRGSNTSSEIRGVMYMHGDVQLKRDLFPRI